MWVNRDRGRGQSRRSHVRSCTDNRFGFYYAAGHIFPPLRNNFLPRLTEQGSQKINDLAQHYGVSVDAVMTLLQALLNSNGAMAQFDHRELGGAGQWMPGGMTMVGDMFNHGLKAKVDGLCSELSQILAVHPFVPFPAGFQSQSQQSHDVLDAGSVRDARPSVGSMVASGTRVPQRGRRAEPDPLCLFQSKTSIGSRAAWTCDRLRHAGSPDQRRLSAAGARRLAYPYQPAWDG
jgi:hypothetical protein